MTAEELSRRRRHRAGGAAHPPVPGQVPEAGGGGTPAAGVPEPAVVPVDPQLLNSIREAVLAESTPVTGARVAAAVQSSGRLLGAAGTLEAVDRVRAELQGLGPLQPFTRDPSVTDILVNGAGAVWIDGGRGLERTQLRLSDDGQVRALASRLIAAGGRRLDDSNPCVDVRLDGFRVHAVLPPVSTAGTLLSIRIRRPQVFTLEELAASGAVDDRTADVLAAIVRQRLNFLISGSTGSGKTTLLSTMLGLSNPAERLVMVEDAAELNPLHPHVVGLQSRHGNVEGTGTVDLAELVRQALRMRPDRLIVGECRGAEVRELLAAMNTGHAGAGGTIHANSAAAVPARLAALGALAGLGSEALNLQASSALDVVIHLERTSAGRQVQEIAVLETAADGSLRAVPALVRESAGSSSRAGWTSLRQLLDGAAR
jgi:pilus assembly protein CpaF